MDATCRLCCNLPLQYHDDVQDSRWAPYQCRGRNISTPFKHPPNYFSSEHLPGRLANVGSATLSCQRQTAQLPVLLRQQKLGPLQDAPLPHPHLPRQLCQPLVMPLLNARGARQQGIQPPPALVPHQRHRRQPGGAAEPVRVASPLCCPGALDSLGVGCCQHGGVLMMADAQGLHSAGRLSTMLRGCGQCSSYIVDVHACAATCWKVQPCSFR